MLLKLYNLNHTLIGGLKNHKDAKVESELSTGDKTLSFLWHSRNKLQISNEYYIRTDTDEFVVKENSKQSNGYRHITARLNLEDIEAKVWKNFIASGCTAKEMADLALADTGWTCVSTVAEEKIRNITLTKVNSYQVFEKIKEAFWCEIQWDTLNKIVYLKKQVGMDKGTYFISGLNLRELTDATDTYDFATEIIPFGADDLDITSVNNGSNFLSNYQYSTKKIAVIWEDSNYTDAKALKDDAEYRLNEISKPKKTRQAKIIDLAKLKPEYKMLSYSVGDIVTLIDDETGIREKQRITKTVEYLESPEKNTCDISNTVLSFAEMQKKLFTAAECVSNVIIGNGTVKGSSVDKIDISQIIGIEEYLSGNLTDLKADYIYAGKELGAVYAAIGDADFTTVDTNTLNVKTRADMPLVYVTELNATNIYGDAAKFRIVEADNISAIEEKVNAFSTDNLEANYAQIDLANVGVESVQELFVNVGLIKDATIVDGHITGYLDAVSINAESIKTGTLSADRLVLNGTEDSLIFALNNIGELVSTHCDTLDGGLITERTITADHIVAGAITAKEIASGTITADKINVDDLFAQDITATGKITGAKLYGTYIETTSGKIGGFNMGASYLANNTTSLGTTANSVYLGTSGISCGTGFKVTAAGALTVNNGKISMFKFDSDSFWVDFTGDRVQDYRFAKDVFRVTVYNASGVERAHIHIDEEGYANDGSCGRAIISANDFIALETKGSFYFMTDDTTTVARIDSTGNLWATSIYENGTALSSKYQAKGNYINAVADVTYGFYGMADPTGATNAWIRTTSTGIIPYQSGGSTAGNCYLGTSSWYFAYAYVQNIHGTTIYENGTALSSKYLARSGGTVTGNVYLAGGTSYYLNSNGSAKLLRIACGGAALSTAYAINASGNVNISGAVTTGALTIDGRTQPATDNARYLGYSSNRWKTVYAGNGTINTSDRTQKHDILYDLDSTKLENIFYELKPVTYIMNNGERTHIGIIAQDAQETIEKYGYTLDDLAFLCRDHEYELEQTEDGYKEVYKFNEDGTPKYIYGVRYTELISLNIWQIQKHKIELNDHASQIEKLQKRVEALETENKELKQKIETLEA